MSYPKDFFPEDLITAGSASLAITTAGTGVLIPSTASGAIYITGFFMSCGASASTLSIGYDVGVAAPTGTAVLIQPVYLGINASSGQSLFQPYKVPASRNVLVTQAGGTTATCDATYYVAP